MTMTVVEETRMFLGESIPDGKDETDTMFSDEEIRYFIGKANGNTFVAEQAAYYGWTAKMAHFANLVTVNEGNASREATELHRNALRMVTRFQPYIGGDNPVNSKGRIRVGQIVRPGGGRGPFGSPARRGN